MAQPQFILKINKFLRTIFSDDENVALIEGSPLLLVHVVALFTPFTGISKVALLACLVTYLLRVFALTGGFHRYFSHRSYKTSRVFQFILAYWGTAAAQLGPLWWAAHHRHHHKHSDTAEDIHSPKYNGFLWAHIGWLFSGRFNDTRYEMVKDWMRYPELRFLDRFSVVAPISLAVGLYFIGEALGAPYGTSGWQMVMWGFFVSTVLVYHVTFCVNSVTHIFGKKRFATRDESRNSFALALVTMGEGWHNNHHRYPISARQGMYWWEIDITYYVLKFLSKLRIVWDLRSYPKSIYQEAKQSLSK